jgi:opacity protein-like surface antigen
MKRAMTILVITFLFSVTSPTWATEESPSLYNNPAKMQAASTEAESNLLGDKFSLTIGLKSWHAALSLDYHEGKPESAANMFGPAVNLTFIEKFYVGMSYYTGSDFKFETTENLYGHTEISKIKHTKSDFDMWAGYQFHPRGSFFIGYKTSTIDSKVESDLSGEDFLTDNYYDLDFKGPVIGISGNYPILDSGFILFGTLGCAFLDVTLKVPETAGSSSREITEKGRGPALEFGLAYTFRRLPNLSLMAGYKYQKYNTSGDKINQDGDLYTLSGVTLGVNYRF